MPRRPISHFPYGNDDDADTDGADLHYHTVKTGRENTVIFWCPHCKHREEEKAWPLDEIGLHLRQCQQCHHGVMRYVAYEAGVEDRIVKRLIENGELPDA